MRLLRSTPLQLRYRALPPQLELSREGRHLLVWGDIPHWMVIDEEFRLFLRALDGAKTWGELLAQNPAWKLSIAQQKEAWQMIYYSAGEDGKPATRDDVCFTNMHPFQPK